MDNILNNIFHTQLSNTGNTADETMKLASSRGINLTDEHWNAIDTVKEIYAKSDFREPSLRELRSHLKQKFKSQGGYRHLYQLFPDGPIDTISFLAGYKPQTASYKGHSVSH